MTDLTVKELDALVEDSLDAETFGYHAIREDDMHKLYRAARRGIEGAVLDDMREWFTLRETRCDYEHLMEDISAYEKDVLKRASSHGDGQD